MEQPTPSLPPIINCHTHVFTVKDVPPLLAKTIVPWPFYHLIRTGWIATPLRKLTYLQFKLQRQAWYKKMERSLYRIRMALKRYLVLRLLKVLIGLLILISIFHNQYDSLIKPWLGEQETLRSFLDFFNEWLTGTPFLIRTENWMVKLLWLLIFFVLFPVSRNILFALLRQFKHFFILLPGKQTIELAKRYANIVRFANYKEQSKVYSRLKLQYPPGSKMVVLPMDMEFMGAGKPPRPYIEQMQLLAEIKDNHKNEFFPFIFVDPRRTVAGDKPFLSYRVESGKVMLEDCFIKDYIEEKNFSGFKIYPALGYFPFDERLLPLWKYAADNGIPIMTHCIRGVIYYRGVKHKDWDYHPIFKQFMGKDDSPEPGDYQPLLLKQMKAKDVQEIFTHPLNYICLYKKELLAQVVRKAEDGRIRELFGFSETEGTISRDLGHLKLCFGHFGGEDEWEQFFEKDRSNFGHQLIRSPDVGIEFLRTGQEEKKGKIEELWKTADWYSIICSLMLQHPHVYADISYILHGDLQILPLLRSTLQHQTLRKRVLYGSDFFVVRNHKSEKNMLADIKGGLLEDEFRQIACINPVEYLRRSNVDEDAQNA